MKKRLNDSDIYERFRSDAECFSDTAPMLQLLEVLREKIYADEVWADISNSTLNFGTDAAHIAVEYWPDADRYRIRYFENQRKLEWQELSTLSETLNLIDEYVIRAHLAETFP